MSGSNRSPRSLSRRSFTRAAAGGAAGAVAAVGLHGEILASRRAPAHLRLQGSANLPTPREQTVVMVESPNNVWDSFNPYIPNGWNGAYGSVQTSRECQFYANYLTGEVRPWLAREYTYNPDFTQVTLKVTPGVTWSDGRPYTSDDILFTQQMLLENPQLNGALDPEVITRVEAPDPETVVWTLAKPDTRFHYRFVAGTGEDGFRVMPRHIWEGQDPGTFTFNPPVQTGPYVLEESSVSQLYQLWRKNPNYWNKANLDPRPEYVIYIQGGPVDTQVQDFLAGNQDMAHQGAGFDYLNQQVVETQTENTSRFDFPDPCPRGSYFNVESPTGLFQTAEGRRAVSMLMDRDLIASTIWQPPSRPATMPWADYEAWTPWAPEEILSKHEVYTYNVDRANQLLDGLGSTRDGDTRTLNGQPLQLDCITPVPTSNIEYQIGNNFATTFKEAGIQLNVRSLPGSAFGDAFSTGQYDMTSHWHCGMQFDPNQLYGGYHSDNYFPVGERSNRGGDQGSTRLRNPEFDALIDKLEVSDPTDPAARPAFDQALDMYLTLAPAVPICQTIYPMMFNTTYWTGWPTAENPYTVPATWWSHFLFAIGNLQPASGG